MQNEGGPVHQLTENGLKDRSDINTLLRWIDIPDPSSYCLSFRVHLKMGKRDIGLMKADRTIDLTGGIAVTLPHVFLAKLAAVPPIWPIQDAKLFGKQPLASNSPT